MRIAGAGGLVAASDHHLDDPPRRRPDVPVTTTSARVDGTLSEQHKDPKWTP